METFLSKAIVGPYIRLYLFEHRMIPFRNQNKDVMGSNHRTILYQSPKYSVTRQIQPIRLPFSTFKRFQNSAPQFRLRSPLIKAFNQSEARVKFENVPLNKLDQVREHPNVSNPMFEYS